MGASAVGVERRGSKCGSARSSRKPILYLITAWPWPSGGISMPRIWKTNRSNQRLKNASRPIEANSGSPPPWPSAASASTSKRARHRFRRPASIPFGPTRSDVHSRNAAILSSIPAASGPGACGCSTHPGRGGLSPQPQCCARSARDTERLLYGRAPDPQV
jgi:hypothetical protein